MKTIRSGRSSKTLVPHGGPAGRLANAGGREHAWQSAAIFGTDQVDCFAHLDAVFNMDEDEARSDVTVDAWAASGSELAAG